MGTIIYKILILLLAPFLCYTLIVGCCKRVEAVWSRRLLSRKGKRTVRRILVVMTMAVFFVIESLIPAFSQPYDHPYDYSNAKQAAAPKNNRNANHLFHTIQKDFERRKGKETYDYLHIPEEYIGAAQFGGMITYYRDTVYPKYWNGPNDSPEKWEPLENSQYPFLAPSYPYIAEAQDWAAKYGGALWPAHLYQCGRALNDAVMKYADIPFPLLLEIAADADSSEEAFLTYHNRNVNGHGDPILIHTEDIGLMHGKLFLHLSECADADAKGKPLMNCLLVQAYCCFQCTRSHTSPQDPLYLKLTYYTAITGERILLRMSPTGEPIPYQSLGAGTLSCYECCITLLEQYPNFYEKEPNMLKNAKAGKATLHSLGFQ